MLKINLFKHGAVLAAALFSTAMINSAYAQDKLNVCASESMRTSLSFMQKSSPVAYDLNIMNDINLAQAKCDLYISANKATILSLVNNKQADINSLQPFARSYLVLWTPNPRLFNRGIDGADLLKDKKIKSLAIVKDDATSLELLNNESLNLSYLKANLKEAQDELAAKNLANDNEVEVALINKTLVTTLTRQSNGSSWDIPQDAYSSIDFYAISAQDSKQKEQSLKLINLLRNDAKTKDLLKSLGFQAL